MVFVEAGFFSKLLPDYLSDDEYRAFQVYLLGRPDAGAVIRGSGGVRKVRWAAGGKGKSGGLRVIYYWLKAEDQIFLLTLYGKGEKEDLSTADLKRIVKLIEELNNPRLEGEGFRGCRLEIDYRRRLVHPLAHRCTL